MHVEVVVLDLGVRAVCTGALVPPSADTDRRELGHLVALDIQLDVQRGDPALDQRAMEIGATDLDD